MAKRTLLLLALPLLLFVGIAAAQSSVNFSVGHFVIAGGGAAQSASFSVTGVIGQPVAAVADGPNFRVSGGFLFPAGAGQEDLWLPAVYK